MAFYRRRCVWPDRRWVMRTIRRFSHSEQVGEQPKMETLISILVHVMKSRYFYRMSTSERSKVLCSSRTSSINGCVVTRIWVQYSRNPTVGPRAVPKLHQERSCGRYKPRFVVGEDEIVTLASYARHSIHLDLAPHDVYWRKMLLIHSCDQEGRMVSALSRSYTDKALYPLPECYKPWSSFKISTSSNCDCTFD